MWDTELFSLDTSGLRLCLSLLRSGVLAGYTVIVRSVVRPFRYAALQTHRPLRPRRPATSHALYVAARNLTMLHFVVMCSVLSGSQIGNHSLKEEVTLVEASRAGTLGQTHA